MSGKGGARPSKGKGGKGGRKPPAKSVGRAPITPQISATQSAFLKDYNEENEGLDEAFYNQIKSNSKKTEESLQFEFNQKITVLPPREWLTEGIPKDAPKIRFDDPIFASRICHKLQLLGELKFDDLFSFEHLRNYASDGHAPKYAIFIFKFNNPAILANIIAKLDDMKILLGGNYFASILMTRDYKPDQCYTFYFEQIKDTGTGDYLSMADYYGALLKGGFLPESFDEPNAIGYKPFSYIIGGIRQTSMISVRIKPEFVNNSGCQDLIDGKPAIVLEPPSVIIYSDSRNFIHHRWLNKFEVNNNRFCPHCWGPKHSGQHNCVYYRRCRMCGETNLPKCHACNYGIWSAISGVPFQEPIALSQNVTTEQTVKRDFNLSKLQARIEAAKKSKTQ